MNSRKLLLIFILMISVISLTAQEAKKESLEELIDSAITVSPRINLLDSKRNVASSRIDIGTNLPDPVLTLGLVNMPTNSFSFTQEPMTGKIIGLAQKFPFPGKLGTASEVRAIDTLIIDQEIADLKNEIRKNVSKLYYDLQLVREETVLAKESRALLEQISEVVKSKYNVSKASLQNVVQVEVQITRVQDRIEALMGKEDALLSELNALLLRGENSPIETDAITPINKSNFSSTALVKEANKYRPFLKGIELSEQKSKLMEELTDYNYYPYFQIGLQYTQRDYSLLSGQNWNDLFSVVIGVSLPLGYGGEYSSQVEEAQYLQIMYKEQYSSSVQSLSQSFGKITAKLNELQNREELVSQTLLPQAEQALQASLADYKVGKIDFVNVINAENDILKIKTDLIKIRTEYSKNITELEFLIGRKINDSTEKDNVGLRLDNTETTPLQGELR